MRQASRRCRSSPRGGGVDLPQRPQIRRREGLPGKTGPMTRRRGWSSTLGRSGGGGGGRAWPDLQRRRRGGAGTGAGGRGAKLTTVLKKYFSTEDSDP
jgi:hypothetical protein